MDWRGRKSRLFSSVAGQFTVPRSLMGRDEPVRVRCSLVSRDFLSIFGWRTVAGRRFSEADHRAGAPPVAILSYGFWQSQFGGSRDIVGRAISLGRSIPRLSAFSSPSPGPSLSRPIFGCRWSRRPRTLLAEPIT